jgi:glycosyltransferase involved in cell wall biosynthesis
VRLAYLSNVYPAVSHSFIRREIEGVEAAGHEVYRFSLRPAGADLKDPADLREAQTTETVLVQGAFALLFAWLGLFARRPMNSVAALKAAFGLSAPGLEQKFLHLAYLLEAAWLTRRLATLKVEHLHAHFGTNPAAVALLVRALGGPPFSLTVHGSEEFDSPVTLALRAKIEAATFVAAISSFTRSQLMRWSRRGDWSKIQVIRCGVDDGFLDAGAAPAPESSTEFVCVARLSAAKGLLQLIAACDRMRSTGEQFSITIVGDGELRDELENEVSRRQLHDVVSLAGVRSSAEVREHLLRARAFVLPSFAEGLPVVIMEALGLSRPVITTAVGGIPELVDRESGWLIPAGSEDALVDAMTAALHASPEELSAKGAVGSERVRRMHDARRNAELIVDAIARSGGGSLLSNDVRPAEKPIEAIPQDPEEFGEFAVEDEPRHQPRL